MITRKGQATRDRIVAAAAALIYERGVAGTSTEDVQAAAGVSASQVYHYFADKRSLTRAVIEYQADAILGFQEPMLVRLDSLEALRSWAAAIVDIQRSNGFRGGCPLGSLASELAEMTARHEKTSWRVIGAGKPPSAAASPPSVTAAGWSTALMSTVSPRLC
jgi:AcrR family transcriptional regulator